MQRMQLMTIKGVIAAVVMAVGCQSVRTGERGGGDSLSLIEAARDCGMVVTVGRGLGAAGAEGGPLVLPAMVNLVAQGVACGENGPEAGSQWFAIGMGVERPQVVVASRIQAPELAQVQLAQDGGVDLLLQGGRSVRIGKAVQPDESMPIALTAGTLVEIRYQGRPVTAAEAKAIGVEKLEIWLMPAGA